MFPTIGAMCTDGYGSNFDFKCAKCASDGEQMATFLAGLTFAILLVGCFTIYTIRKMGSKDQWRQGTNIIVKISMTGWSMIQSMTFFRGFDYEWPPLIEGLFSTSELASGSRISMQTECWAKMVSDQPYVYTNAVFMILLAAVCLLIIVLGLLILALFKGAKHLKRNILIAAIYVMFFFQPYAVRGILQALTCISVGDESVLFYQMDVLCDSDLHVSWTWALVSAYMIYVVVLPGWLMAIMYRDRALFLAEDEETIRTFGFAINAFKAEFFYWQFVIMYRKIAQMTLITLSRPAGIVVQAQLALMVSMVATGVHLQMKPFKNELVNNLEKVSLGSFAITAWVGVLMSQSEVKTEGHWGMVMTTTILMVNTFALLYVLYALATQGCSRIQEKVNELRESQLPDAPPTSMTDIELAEVNPVAMATLDQEEEDRKDLEEVGIIADDDERMPDCEDG